MVTLEIIYLGMLVLNINMLRAQKCINEKYGHVLRDQKDLCYSGLEDLDLRVVGGKDINATDVPWHTIISINKNGVLDASSVIGGGNIITPRLVLTAAHLFWANSKQRRVCPREVLKLESAEACHQLDNGCPNGCQRVIAQSIELYFGVTNLKRGQPEAYRVADLYLHPGWNKKTPTEDTILDGHDIAILRTNQPVKFSPGVQPICLPHPNLDKDIGIPEKDVSIAGFGRDGKSQNSVVEILQLGCIYIVGKLGCKKSYNFTEWKGDQICAIGAGVDSCRGDSGGGLVANIDNVNVLIGVTSFGSRSCASGRPAMYTNVKSHLEWITNIIEGNTIETPLKIDSENTEVSEKLVVLGGWVGIQNQSNTVFMEVCPVMGTQIPDLPQNISHGVGTTIKSKSGISSSIVICGGIAADSGPINDCFEIDVSKPNEVNQWKRITDLKTKRGNAAINFLPFSQVVWITGGRKSSRIILDSTEILTKVDGVWEVREGPTLPRPVASHCSVTISDGYYDKVILIGGASFDSQERKFVMTDIVESYEFENGGRYSTKTNLASLRTPRSGHACTLITNREGEETIIVAGGQRASKDVLYSVESIPVHQLHSGWSEHSYLPQALTGATFITKLGLPFLIGGAGYGSNEGTRKPKDIVFSKDVLAYTLVNDDIFEESWKKIGEVQETVAYHVTVALENTICLEIKKDLRESFLEDLDIRIA